MPSSGNVGTIWGGIGKVYVQEYKMFESLRYVRCRIGDGAVLGLATCGGKAFFWMKVADLSL